MRRFFDRQASCILLVLLAGGCAGGGAQGSFLPGSGPGAGSSLAGVAAGATVVRVHLAGAIAQPPGATGPQPSNPPTTQGGAVFAGPGPGGPVVGPPAAGPPAPNGAAPAALTLAVSGPATANQTIALTAGSPGCAGGAAGLVCQSALSLPPGTYQATVALYASPNAPATSTIGALQTIAFTVSATTPNVVNLSAGVPIASIALVPATSLAAPNAQNGIDLFGSGKHQLLAEPLDAAQNTVVGLPAATYGFTQTGGGLALAVAPSFQTPNALSVTPGQSLGQAWASLRATVAFPGQAANPCVAAGASCSSTVTLDVRQLLAVANSATNSVSMYAGGQTSPLASIQSGLAAPTALVFDPAGDVFVANSLGNVTESSPPYIGQPASIGGGVSHPQALAMDARGDLFVANGSATNTVTEYAPPYSGAPIATISNGVNDPVSIALDASGDLFVANQAASTVTEYAPPYGGTPVTLSAGLSAPSSLAVDGRGNVFVSNLNSTPSSVVEFSPPFSAGSLPAVTIANGVSEQGAIGLGPASTLFVPNQGSNSVTAYAPPYAGAPVTIVGGQSQPLALAVDASGSLYVANYGNNTVTVYAPPYSGGSWLTLGYGISAPQALALSPPTALAGSP